MRTCSSCTLKAYWIGRFLNSKSAVEIDQKAFENNKNISVGFSYADGCSYTLRWSDELFYMAQDGKQMPHGGEVAISIENGHTKEGVLLHKDKKVDEEINISGVIVAGLLILLLIYICWKYACRPKPVLPTASTANPSAPMAVTCLPDVKVVKPTATTQPPPVSCDLKQGQKPVPIPQPPVSSELKQGQEPAPIPPPPVPVVEKDLPAVPSEKLLAIDDGDEVRLAPNTIEITSLEKKRRKNRRMLKAVDDDEKSAALRGRSLALRNKKGGQNAKSHVNVAIPYL
uniref:Uncharacterized protein n=1 Tax=Ditylenchus dipsaci TaxID=166011 RepID=A0A915D886_9BILA